MRLLSTLHYADMEQSYGSLRLRRALLQEAAAAGGKTAAKPLVGILVGSIAAALVVLIVIICIVCRCVQKRRATAEKKIPYSEQTVSEVLGGPQAATVIPYETLAEATNQFDPTQKIGDGRFGPIFRGELPEGMDVAVRRLSLNSRQGKREFVKGVKNIMDLNHRNVVRLIGCCYTNARLLAYEYLENGSLAAALFDRRKNLDWPTRFNILLGTASGLAYLHEESQNIFAHGDIKAGNILLDKIMKPKIADFGLANLFRNDQNEVKARNMTSVGYMSPELAVHGNLSAKADVFAFGILCLEVVSGRLNTDINLIGTDMQHLLSWAWQLQENHRTLDMVDNRIKDSYREDQAKKVIEIALLSTQDTPASRPSMSRIVAMLKSEEPIPTLPSRPAVMQSLGLGQQNISGTFTSSYVAPKRASRWTSKKHHFHANNATHSGIFNSGIFNSGIFNSGAGR